ncbi:DNA repair exonuclease SbcCD nuclease subunit [Desulfobaculum xiamenense]|uniref:DNA repair exonuclease SbcCD nuclease subunit n=1 Tax=Desulfobaculum xiamenense TaxID=995050 RepID=A0A846QR43_9BACT|nr:DNA repair exonuclease [Desulfobaculum xiamenense]NJB68952.1 DNA repair exonuclease SbcCD nuclease subunit [Desulfobaculum xiamenense]
MPSFIHAGDIHLDSPLKGLERYDGAPAEEVRAATRRALDTLVTYTLDEGIPLVVLAGDIYDGDWKDFQTGLFFASQMTRLRHGGVRVVMLHGNHDAASSITRHLPLPENVTVLDSRQPQTVVFDDLTVAVHGQSFPTPAVTENLAANYPTAIAGLFNIGLLHTAASGSEGHANYAPCSMADLAATGYDYWALGHVHDHKILGTEPPVVYCGCLQGRHIRETGPKGCVRVDVDASGHAVHTFVPMDVMRWASVAVDATDAATTHDIAERFATALGDELRAAEGRPLAVRLTITGACAAHAELSADPDRTAALIRHAATDASAARAWVEKIILATSAPVDVAALRSSNTPQGELLRYLDRLESGDENFDDLGFDIADLRTKLPAAIDLPDTSDPAVRSALVRDARELLLARIVAHSGDVA